MDTRLNKQILIKLLLFILSVVSFIASAAASFMGGVFMFLAITVFYLKKAQLKNLSEIGKDTYIFGLIIVSTLVLLNRFQNFLLSGIISALSLYFIVQSIEFIKTLFAEKRVGLDSSCDGKLTIGEIITIICSSIVAMTLNTTSSPLYKINYWGDAHIYFTLGKAINDGLVLYRDIYDHKGPYIYFVHAIAALISKTSFFGVFIIEIIAAIVFSIFIWKTVKLFYKPKHMLLLVPLQIVLSYFTYAFWYGDSAEELCIPLLAITVYIALKAEKKQSLPSFKETIVIGAISGYLFMFKFNFCALIIGYLLFVIVSSIFRRNLAVMWKDVGAFLIGAVIVLIPVIIYFTVNDSWMDFFEVYFHDNLIVYPKLENSLMGKYVSIIYYAMVDNPNIAAMLCFSVFALAAMKKGTKILYLLMFIFQTIFLFSVNLYIFYYSLIYLALTAIGWILVSIIFDGVCETIKLKKQLLAIVPSGVIVIMMGITVATCDNFFFINQPEEDIPQLTFSKIINQTENPTILTYKNMHSSYYTYSGVTPNCKYSFMTNMDYIISEHTDYQDSMIANGEFDYIITSQKEYEFDNYELVASQFAYTYRNSPTEGYMLIDTMHYLYKRIE